MKYFFCMRCILCKFLFSLSQNSHPSIYTNLAHLYPHFLARALLFVPILECGLNAVVNFLGLLLLAYNKWSSHSHTPSGLSYSSWCGTPQCFSFRPNASCPHSTVSQEHQNQVPIWKHKMRETFHMFTWEQKNKKSLLYCSSNNDSKIWNQTFSAVLLQPWSV